MENPSQQQAELNSMLRRGVLFSIFWLMGVGSLIAVINGVKARRIIQRSNGELEGAGQVIWCLVVGGVGLLFWGFVIVMVMINRVTG